MLTEIGWALLRIGIVLGFILLIVPGLIWIERRVLAWMQDRVGPNRVGPAGLLQPIADGIKLFFKEEILPFAVDKTIWWLAPAIALFPAFVAAATLPWGPNKLLTPIADIDAGVLYFLAITSLTVYGIVLAGWSSNNKYALLGGLRSSAQLISYELSMGLALGAIILTTGSLTMTQMVEEQAKPLWGVVEWVPYWFLFTPWGLVGAFVFLVCMVAETNRTPFDLPEAESELVAGFHTEYTSMKFAVFFMGEYAAMLIISGIMVTCFLGGYLPPLNVEPLTSLENLTAGTAIGGLVAGVHRVIDWFVAPFWFLIKVFSFIFFYIWFRATLPRLRYDQLMALGWKGLLPIALLNLMMAALYYGFGWKVTLTGYGVLIALYGIWALSRLRRAERRRVELYPQAVPWEGVGANLVFAQKEDEKVG